MSIAANALATLADNANVQSAEAEFYFGTVTVSTSTSVTVVPDSSFDGAVVGPMVLIGTKTVPVDGRVLCARFPGGGHACLGKVSGG